MSVAQVKKRFGEFESYLRRDTEGLRRLKLLKDDVNVLRTSLASAQHAEETAKQIASTARERTDKAEMELQDILKQNRQLTSVVDSLRQQIASLTKVVEKEDNDDTKSTGVYADVKRTVKRLRQTLPQCPQMIPPKIQKEKKQLRNTEGLVYRREDFATGWTHNDMWVLGASVALLAAMDGQVTVMSEQRTEDIIADKTGNGFAFNMCRWFRGNIDKRSDKEVLQQKAAAPFGGVRWGDKPEDAEMTAAFFDGADE
jgi:hypothetical protein